MKASLLEGHVDMVKHHVIKGWAADLNDHARRVEVLVRVDAEEVGRAIADSPRPDLQDILSDDRHGFTFWFCTPMLLTKDYHIEVLFSETGDHLKMGACRLQRGTSKTERTILPILVTSTGRAGSSLLMHRLAREPSVVVAGGFPFEVKLLTYYSKVFNIALSPSPNATDRRVPIYADPSYVSFNPFHHSEFQDLFDRDDALFNYFAKEAAPKVGECFLTLVSGFYSRLRNAEVSGLSRYYAEKCSIFDPVRDFVREFDAEAREFVVVRDPRDLFCSFRSFWKMPPHDAMQRLRAFRELVVRIMESGSEHVEILRYEDILDESGTVDAFRRLLGIENPLTDKNDEEELDATHRTASSSVASIARWRTELEPEQAATIRNEFGDLLQELGYDS